MRKIVTAMSAVAVVLLAAGLYAHGPKPRARPAEAVRDQ
jgi:hypothetical protein